MPIGQRAVQLSNVQASCRASCGASLQGSGPALRRNPVRWYLGRYVRSGKACDGGAHSRAQATSAQASNGHLHRVQRHGSRLRGCEPRAEQCAITCPMPRVS
eukprot:9183819-Alexandrium_andersonii.AAC.1